MPTPYLGQARPPVGQDTPQQPMPLAAPQPMIPADADPNNVATMLLQQFQSFADFLAFLNTCARYFPPIAFGTPNTSWSAVKHVGPGLGTVTPIGVAQLATGSQSGNYYVVKITLGGAVGTAMFQLSLDGGVTYGAQTVTAAQVTQSGITIAFDSTAGNFVLNDTYAFWPAATPRANFVDLGGYNRFLIDAWGYPGGRINEIRGNWHELYNTALTGGGSGQFLDMRSWLASVVIGSLALRPPTNGDTFAGGNPQNFTMLALQAGGTGAERECVYYANTIGITNDLVLVMEWELAITTLANNMDIYCALTSGLGVPDSDLVFARFFRTSGGNWIAQCKDGTTMQFANTNVAPVANRLQRFKIVMCGPTSAFGKRIDYFIDETHVSVLSGNTPWDAGTLSTLRPTFANVSNASGATGTTYLSPVHVKWARWPSLQAPNAL